MTVTRHDIIEGLHRLGLGPGSIVLAHDLHAPTVDAMPGTLDGLLEKGYQFVTVSQLLAQKARAR